MAAARPGKAVGAVEERYRHVAFLDIGAPASASIRGQRGGRTRKRDAIEEALPSDSAAYFNALCGRWGLRAHRYRRSIFRRREAASLRALRAASLSDAVLAVRTDAAGAERALRAVMIGVTSFFRDPAVFQSLRVHMKRLHDQRGGLNILSVGCSDGSELYSTAILLADDDLLSSARLSGIDCRPDAIEKARAGVYAVDAVADLPGEVVERYFEPAVLDARFGRRGKRCRAALRVKQPLRDACEWEVADGFTFAGQNSESFDVILCRNVAIYLTLESAGELWSSLASQLSPGGLLVVGKAERPSGVVRAECERVSQCIYQKRATVE